ncbi:hypothetical protein LV84_03466 [Algoriphagus ratkowskyi]|uniref:Uncharacterized protein n=1 Tax=Algoriphagus ratkowskyi TaxID=57028 RepID=A0A2W7R2I5_9BACT|nr:hypothetical protein [Algoriphagus ratkowskyi]PZX52460.1 hypothetical protein LV84_03466 [Algoriphagus ratkowskyi]TXD76195.1 hypothetical protein ESW18_17340 [Algoriphagus ratkowskyi]
MFGFFNKKAKTGKNLGAFSSYGMEEIYYFLSENRIESKIKDLERAPTLGTRIEDFVSSSGVSCPSGELHFFWMLLGYFKNDLDLGIYLIKKSKSFDESNYPKKLSLKEGVKLSADSMDRLAKKNPEKKELYILNKRPIFWLEYDLFHFYTIKNFIYNYNLKKLNGINLEGSFKKKGSVISALDFHLIFRSMRKPKSGFYLTVKSDHLLNELKFDLLELSNNKTFSFETFFGSYQIEISSNQAIISKIKSYSNPKIDLVLSTDILRLIKELTLDYLSNFDKITERFINDVTKPNLNFFLGEALRINNIGEIIIKEIEKELVKKSEIWGELEQYKKVKWFGYP